MTSSQANAVIMPGQAILYVLVKGKRQRWVVWRWQTTKVGRRQRWVVICKLPTKTEKPVWHALSLYDVVATVRYPANTNALPKSWTVDRHDGPGVLDRHRGAIYVPGCTIFPFQKESSTVRAQRITSLEGYMARSSFGPRYLRVPIPVACP